MNAVELIEMFPDRKPGPWVKRLLESNLKTREEIEELMEREFPTPVTIPLQNVCDVPMNIFLDMESENNYIRENNEKVVETLQRIIQTPYVRRVVALPDSCPTGLHSVPVGVTLTSNRIHPGFHSADRVCSMAATVIRSDTDPQLVFDAAKAVSHFGGGKRSKRGMTGELLEHFECPRDLSIRMRDNKFTHSAWRSRHLDNQSGTIGDGNHHLNVLTDIETNDVWIITHHGGRKNSALIYKEGIKSAEKHCKEVCPDLFRNENGGKEWSWISEEDEEEYWQALKLIEEWTKFNHECTHQAILNKLNDETINASLMELFTPHNFVFKEIIDGNIVYHHAKGSTPLCSKLNSQQFKIIPLNMRAPTLLVSDHPENKCKFGPHGAGRIVSRVGHLKSKGLSDLKNPSKYKEMLDDGTIQKVLNEEFKGSKVQPVFWTGNPDLTEAPSAYKNSNTIIEEIEKYKLAKIEKKLEPFGSIMSGIFLNQNGK